MTTNYTFEDFLRQEFAGETEGNVLADTGPDAFERWVENLGSYEFIHFADKYAEKVRNGEDKPLF